MSHQLLSIGSTPKSIIIIIISVIISVIIMSMQHQSSYDGEFHIASYNKGNSIEIHFSTNIMQNAPFSEQNGPLRARGARILQKCKSMQSRSSSLKHVSDAGGRLSCIATFCERDTLFPSAHRLARRTTYILYNNCGQSHNITVHAPGTSSPPPGPMHHFLKYRTPSASSKFGHLLGLFPHPSFICALRVVVHPRR